jgi:hypothetical protein
MDQELKNLVKKIEESSKYKIQYSLCWWNIGVIDSYI